eukprot:333102_1
MRRISARGYGTRPVKGFTKSKCIGFSILALTNIIFIFLVLIHAPNHPSRDTITANLERNKWAPKIHKMSLPLPEDPVIHGIAKEKLPFTEIIVNNKDPKRMYTSIAPSDLNTFDWSREVRGSESIFISIPSLNDPDCNETIASAFGQSSNPDRIYFGIYEQNAPQSHLDCLDFSGVDCPYHPICSRKDHIRITRVDVKEAKGPTWGRYNADKLYGGQQFVFVSDSHTFFRAYWDMLLLDLWYKTGNEYAIISHYPKPDQSIANDMYKWYKDKRFHPMSYHICGSVYEIAPNHMPRNANGCYAHIEKRDELQSALVPFWAAGFSFSKAHVRDNVKWDPHTTYIFHGEEFHFSTRAWTHGYDFYSPPFDIAFHRYYDSKRTKRYNINNVRHPESDLGDAAEKRVNALWGLLELRTPNERGNADLEDIDKYPLGKERSLSDYWSFCGIDPVEKTFTVFKENVWTKGGLQRIPWKDRSRDPVLNP